MTWDRQLYFPSKGSRSRNFIALKSPSSSAGFEHANLGSKGNHAIITPAKATYGLYLPVLMMPSLGKVFECTDCEGRQSRYCQIKKRMRAMQRRLELKFSSMGVVLGNR
jgi:hypothetical protein